MENVIADCVERNTATRIYVIIKPSFKYNKIVF